MLAILTVLAVFVLISQRRHSPLYNLCNSLKGCYFLDILTYLSTGSAYSGVPRSATVRPLLWFYTGVLVNKCV